MVAAAYGSANHAAALREIRQWPPPEIAAAVADLRRRGKPAPIGPERSRTTSRSAPSRPPSSCTRRPASLALQALSQAEAEVHLGASTTLFEWSREAAAEARTRRQRAIDADARPRPAWRSRRESTAGTSTWPWPPRPSRSASRPTARPFAEKARERRAARSRGPARVRLRGRGPRRGEAPPAPRVGGGPLARRGGPRACATRWPSTPGLHEARLHLGRLLLVRGRLIEAEPLLEEVDGALGRRLASATSPGSSSGAWPSGAVARRRRPPSTPGPSRAGPTARPRGSPSPTPSRGRPAPRPRGRWSRRASPRPGGSTARPTRGGSTPSARRASPRPPSIALWKRALGR